MYVVAGLVIVVIMSHCITITVSAARVRACGGRCWDGCDIGTVLRISGKTIDRFQCTWVTMIGEMHELIAKYLGNGFR